MKIQVLFEPVNDDVRFNPDAQILEIALRQKSSRMG